MSNSSLLFGMTGASLFNQRVVSRPVVSTVFVEQPTPDPWAARLEEALKKVVDVPQDHLFDQLPPAPLNLDEIGFITP